MEHTPLPPLVSDEKLQGALDKVAQFNLPSFEAMRLVRDAYESDRAKTREVVQALVDALDEMKDAFELYASCQCDGNGCAVCRKLDKADNALFVARSMNIKPSRP